VAKIHSWGRDKDKTPAHEFIRGAWQKFIRGGETRIKPQPTDSFMGRGKNSFVGALKQIY